MSTNNNQDKEKLVNSIVKGIAYAENGGKPNIENPSAGQSGEMKSIFQFEPATWKADAKEFLGNENAPLTADNETYVMQQKVSQWIDEGKNVDEMASIHNSGNPNAYKENHRGKNRYGVAYDTPAYAQKVKEYSQQFYKESPDSNIDSSGAALSTQKTPLPQTPIDTTINKVTDAQQSTPAPTIQGDVLVPNQSMNPNQTAGMLPSQPVSPTNLKPKLAGLFGGNVKTNIQTNTKKVRHNHKNI